jgi:hypothetical protein
VQTIQLETRIAAERLVLRNYLTRFLRERINASKMWLNPGNGENIYQTRSRSEIKLCQHVPRMTDPVPVVSIESTPERPLQFSQESSPDVYD